MPQSLRAIDEILERAYARQVVIEGRSLRPIAETMGHPLPPEPEGLTEIELAKWYLDTLEGLS